MRITIEIDETAKEPGAATVGIQPSPTATPTASSDAVEVFDGGPAPSGSAGDISPATTLAYTTLDADGLAAGPAPAL
jgi:hypothetical protein